MQIFAKPLQGPHPCGGSNSTLHALRAWKCYELALMSLDVPPAAGT
jgi:hypothetical protein